MVLKRSKILNFHYLRHFDRWRDYLNHPIRIYDLHLAKNHWRSTGQFLFPIRDPF